MRGRHFGFLGTLCTVWITARVGFLVALPAIAAPPKSADTSRPKGIAAYQAPPTIPAAKNGLRANRQRQIPLWPAVTQKLRSAANTVNRSQHELLTAPAADTAPVRPPTRSPTLWGWPSSLPPASRSQSPLNVYAYSFVRSGGQNSGLGGGQYGGSQSGVIATYTVASFNDAGGQSRLALLVRGAIAHDDPAERELAAGLRWQPARKTPLSLTAERRFRNARPDAFAVYLAGGKSAKLPLKFRLDSFAQAGVVSGKDGGPFFDVSARAERKLSITGKTPVTFGAGIWGGGQTDVIRVDVGPSIGTEARLGNTRVRINADWRFRIAGDAQPASGPALTLSTSF